MIESLNETPLIRYWDTKKDEYLNAEHESREKKKEGWMDGVLNSKVKRWTDVEKEEWMD